MTFAITVLVLFTTNISFMNAISNAQPASRKLTATAFPLSRSAGHS